MYFSGTDQLVGVVGVHGVGAVRIPQTLGDTPKPTKVKVSMPILPTKRDVPPTFNGTHVGQLAIPRDKTLFAWKWNGKVWDAITQAQAASEVKAQGLKTAGVAAPKPVVKPTTPPVQPGRFVGDVFLPSDKAAHAWQWDGTVWRGIARSAALKPTAATTANAAAASKAANASILDKIIAAVTPNSANVPDLPVADTPKVPTQPGKFIGQTFLPTNPAFHAWRWTGKAWQGIARSDALKPSVADKQAAADYALAQKMSFTNQVKEAVTGAVVGAGRAETSLIDKITSKLSPPISLPHPEVTTVAPGAAPPGFVNNTAGGQSKLPTPQDPDADGQKAPGVPAPPPTPGAPGTYPVTAQDKNGSGVTPQGTPVVPPTLGVKGTFPSTPLDKDGDGYIDSTGAVTPPPILGQKGTYPATPHDADGDGLDDSTGKPLNANGLSHLDLGSLTVPLLGMAAAVLLFSRKQGGSVRQWR